MQGLHQLPLAKQQRRRVACADPGQDACVGVELGEDRGGERLTVEGEVDIPVNLAGGVGQGPPRTPGLAVCRDRQGSQLRGLQPVTHAVEHREPGTSRVDGIVQGVASHLVGRLENPRHHHLLAGEGQRGQHRPLHLGGKAHLRTASGAHDGVAVQRLGHHELGHDRGEAAQSQPLQPRACARYRWLAEGEAQHAQAFGSVKQRHPHPGAATGRAGMGHDLHVLERPPRRGGVDRQRLQVPLGARACWPGERHEHQLLKIGQVSDSIARSQDRGVLGDQRGELVWRGQVRRLHQCAERLFPGAHDAEVNRLLVVLRVVLLHLLTLRANCAAERASTRAHWRSETPSGNGHPQPGRPPGPARAATQFTCPCTGDDPRLTDRLDPLATAP